MPDGLFGLATALVAIPSVSHVEGPMADAVEAALRLCPWLEVERVGDNVVARTDSAGQFRVLIGRPSGHRPAGRGQRGAPHRGRDPLRGRFGRHEGRPGRLPPPGRHHPRAGRGRDLVLLRPVRRWPRSSTDCASSGSTGPNCWLADAAILGEPTDGVVEAGLPGHPADPDLADGAPGPHRPPPAGPQRHPPAGAGAGRGGGLPRPPAGTRRLRVRRAAPGGRDRRRGGRQRRPRPGLVADQSPVRPGPDRRGGRGRPCGTCSGPTSRPGDRWELVDCGRRRAPGAGPSAAGRLWWRPPAPARRPNWAGPTWPRSGPTGSRPPTSGPATPWWPTPRTSA